MSCKTAKLKELCTVKSGAPTSRAKKIAEGAESREVKVLLPRAMRDGSIVDAELDGATIGEVGEENFTREGDVVVKLSTPYDTVYIDKAHEGILVSSSSMVLRKRADAELDMQYLSVFLNLPRTNAMLQAVSTGQSAALAVLKRQAVDEIEVPLPPIERQRQLAALFQAVRERRCLYLRLIALDEELVTSQTTKLIWGEEE